VVTTPDDPDRDPIFRWETIEEVGSFELKYQGWLVPGKILELELTSGGKVRVWRADNGQEYFCHGLTFGGKDGPNGAISPHGEHVPTILRGHYEAISAAEALAGDILVWRGASADDVVHSATLTDPIVSPRGNDLDYTAKLQTKNGILPETNMTLGRLVENLYGESYRVYRRKTRHPIEESKS